MTSSALQRVNYEVYKIISKSNLLVLVIKNNFVYETFLDQLLTQSGIHPGKE